LKDYKPVLTVSVKPENAVKTFIDLVAILSFSVCLVVFVTANDAMELSIGSIFLMVSMLAVSLVFIFITALFCLHKYYCLQSPKSVSKLCMNAEGEWRLIQNDQYECAINIIDKLLINNHLILYFRKKSQQSQSNQLVQATQKIKQFSIKEDIKNALNNFAQEFIVFLGFNRQVIVISEQHLGQQQFCHLLRQVQVHLKNN